MNTNIKRIVVVAADQVLKDKHYYLRLWMAMRNKDISSREFLDVMANAIYFFDGIILSSDGSIWDIPHIDDVVTSRSISNFKRKGADDMPYMIARNAEALRLYDTTFKIKWPDIARHFGR